MLVIGKVGWGPNIHDTRLTPNEQITHISLWTIQAAPLLIGADMAQFDKFTTDLMTNHEVLEINQDVLGKAARRACVSRSGSRCGRGRSPTAPMAVALFNRGLQAANDDGDVGGHRRHRQPAGARSVAAARPGHVRGRVHARRCRRTAPSWSRSDGPK